MADDEHEILAILRSPAPGDRDVGAEEAELVSGALAQFESGFSDGWHGREKKHRTGVYSRAYVNGTRGRRESDYFLK